MERVAFIVEHTDQHLGCLLNPESVVIRRRAGVGTRQSAGGLVTGSDLADDPVFFTGGGSTELTLDLLFDVNLPGCSVASGDVRDLTGPLARLAENGSEGRRRGPAPARFIWGLAWDMRGIITAVAERLEDFTRGGAPQRCWMRLRMLRVAETAEDLIGGSLPPPGLPEDLDDAPARGRDDALRVHEVLGDAGAEGGAADHTERLDLLAHRYYGDPAEWRALAWLNGVTDPLRLRLGQTLQVAARADGENR